MTDMPPLLLLHRDGERKRSSRHESSRHRERSREPERKSRRREEESGRGRSSKQDLRDMLNSRVSSTLAC